MKIIIAENYDQMSKKAADIFANQLKEKEDSTLGLATGSTPTGMYKHLIEMYKNGEISFKSAKTFNLDEYMGLPENHEQSYSFFMNENLFDHVDINKENINIPKSNVSETEINTEVERYNHLLDNSEIDIQVLGIGRNGHIGFNEPGDAFTKNATVAELTEDTIKANSRFFDNIEDVPQKAITMGIKQIMMAKKIILLANGKSKSEIIKATITGKITPFVPASVLQLHKDVTIILDKEAAELL